MVQNMNLDKLEIPHHVQVKYIQKKYYNKYFYKITLKLDQNKLIKDERSRSRGFSYSYYSNRFSLLNDVIEQVKQVIVDDDYRFRTEGINVSVFTNSEANISMIIDKMGSQVTILYRPLNSAHIDIVENYNKVLVRSSLFENEYKFKVYLKFSWEQRENRFKEYKDWLEESNLNYGINKTLNQYFYTNKGMRGIGYTAAVYFNDPQDLMIFQLRFNDRILKIEEAILLSDL